MAYDKKKFSRPPKSLWHVVTSPPTFRPHQGVSFREKKIPPSRDFLSPIQRTEYPRVPPVLPHIHIDHNNNFHNDSQQSHLNVWSSPPASTNWQHQSSHHRAVIHGSLQHYPSKWELPWCEYGDRWESWDNDCREYRPHRGHGHSMDDGSHDKHPYRFHQRSNRQRFEASSFDELGCNKKGTLGRSELRPWMVSRGHTYPAMGPHVISSHSYDFDPTWDGRHSGNVEQEPAGLQWGSRELWETKNMKRHNSLPTLDRRKSPGLYQMYGSWDEKRGLWSDTSFRDLMSLRFLADSVHAASFIERFVHSCIEGLILGVAAAVLVETKELQDVIKNTSVPVILAAEDVLREVLHEEMMSVSEEERQTAIASYWKEVANSPDLHQLTDSLLFDWLEDELMSGVIEAVDELVNDYLKERQVVDVFDQIYDEVAEPLLLAMANEALLDLSIDSLITDFIEDEIQLTVSGYVADVLAIKGCPQYSDIEIEC